MPKEKQEEKVSMYDPTVDAFREITISNARKLIKSTDEVKALLEASGKLYE